MRISALCNHLRHPLTYTDAQGKPQRLSLEEIGQVTIFVLSSMAAATFEAVASERSLKSSCFSIVIITGSSFYLATAIIKMASRGNGPSKPGEDRLRKKMDPVTHTLQVSVIGSPDKSEWHVIDPPRSEKKGNKQQVNHSVEVSAIGLQDNNGWMYLESRLQKTTIIPVKAESPRKVPVTENLPDNPDEIMQISILGSPNNSEWVYTEAPTISPISTQDRPDVTEKGKKDEEANLLESKLLVDEMVSILRASDDKKKQRKKEPDLTVSVFGSQVNEWAPITSNIFLSYQQLTVSKDQILVISKMIQTIGDTYLVSLYFKQAELIEMGEKIENVHPLKFLETILNNPVIKKSMLDIKSSNLKWNGFLKGDKDSPGFIDKCQQEDNLGNFAPYIKDFCRAVNVDSQNVLSLFEAREWEKLISFLVQ